MPHYHAVALSPRNCASFFPCFHHRRSFFHHGQQCPPMPTLLPRTGKEAAGPTGFRGVSPSAPRLPTLQQFVIEKQGRFDRSFWHTRVLTIDTAHGRLYLSKAHKAENLDHRCMNRIDSVELWPAFNSDNIPEYFGSELARRTVYVRGLVGIKSESFFTRWFRSSDARTKEAEVVAANVAQTRASASRSEPHDIDLDGRRDTIEASVLYPVDSYMRFEAEIWLIRCMTLHDLHEMADAFRAAIPEASPVLKGYQALKQRLAGSD
ncbi:hypothetical protein LMJF_31_2420 [Leishmania major strain Friedlin]|uniref:Uncharacterized protein n=1 Tax=Leishmania major TaxID=5664 RepID=Q4Q619_LEIMA|nr:hypothetical protein LMJF_31_2420 [Leishmania major strain Friedlin]CAG9579420.1 hypothetical_protein_-_conserved [Leishmania major strain Friedlin]CAJ08431.1 hypothetical protein LMJF_31_2420 [Leishmania major strain Friedlin]|eukprot:XP_001685229.1 hypothetical protein LMJF_31_2420 [Leishmania major strain Friedlin]